jgi:general secretion pathway protein E
LKHMLFRNDTQPTTAPRRDPRDPSEVRAFLDALVAQGALDAMSSARAREAQRETRERIDVVVTQLGLLTDTALADALARAFSLPRAHPDEFPAIAILDDQLDAAFLRRTRILPLSANATTITLATADPFATDTLASVGFLLDRVVNVRIASPSEISQALDALYGGGNTTTSTASANVSSDATANQDDDVQRLKDLASEAPVIRHVNRLIADAIDARASDIHIEPFPDSVRVRYRIDGVMSEVERLPPDLQVGIASRIKILARLNVAERRVPQDGRAKIVHRGREIDLRIATAPLLNGESLVLRLLDRAAVALDFPTLGFDADAIATLERLLAQPNGIVLVTGPTGSGKTTTLYAALSRLNAVERKVFTVEDPIEYQLPGVNQMQIKPAIDFDFAAGLRAILRQDPDVVMVGEMRDTETARTGVQAALTGHLVLSTLHTNSAAASITRLLDMGVEDYLLASSVTGIVAQRLVRRLCSCATLDADGRAAIAAVDLDFAAQLPDAAPKHACGCKACRGTGFHGRTTIAEILVVDDTARGLFKRGITDREIEATARSHGMETLLQNGLRKVAAGETTLAEVLRVTRS